MADDTRGPRERAYDEHMAPLVDQLIALSKEHAVPLFLNAMLDGDMQCTTSIPSGASDTEIRELGWFEAVACEDRFRWGTRVRFIDYAKGTPSRVSQRFDLLIVASSPEDA